MVLCTSMMDQQRPPDGCIGCLRLDERGLIVVLRPLRSLRLWTLGGKTATASNLQRIIAYPSWVAI